MSTTISSIWGTAMARKPSLLKRHKPRPTLVYTAPSYHDKPLPPANEFLDTIVVSKNPRRRDDKRQKKPTTLDHREVPTQPPHDAPAAVVPDEPRDWLSWGDDVDDMIRWVQLWGTAMEEMTTGQDGSILIFTGQAAQRQLW